MLFRRNSHVFIGFPVPLTAWDKVGTKRDKICVGQAKSMTGLRLDHLPEIHVPRKKLTEPG